MLSFESPVRTPWHDLPAGLKLSFLCVMTVVLFLVESALGQALALLGCALLYAVCGRIIVLEGLRRLRVLVPFILVLLVWHGFTHTLAEGLILSARLLTLVALSNLITMSTRLSDIMAFLNSLLWPVRKLGLRTRPLELAIALVVRFTPALTEKGQCLTNAWRVRSFKRPGWQIVLPLSLVAIDDAEHVAEALKARGGLVVPTDSTATVIRKSHGT